MKKILSCTTVAILCCAANSSFGQIRILGGGPTPSAILVSAQLDESAEVDSDTDTDSSVSPFPIPNPFDFGDPAPEPEANAAPELPATQATDDPSSLPVGRRHRRRAVVDTIVDYSSLASVPDSSIMPVDWTQSVRTPNPVAEIMLREYCVNGLWAGYPAQRAAECAAMWDRINGCKHQCGMAGNCATCTSGCNNQPRNRYLQQPCDNRL